MKLCVLCVSFVTLIVSFVMFLFRKQILLMLYPDAEAGIMNESIRYFTVSILSYPFMALYYTTAACFRAIRKSNITLYGSFLMSAVNLIAKYLFIFLLKLEVVGAALSAIAAFGLVGFVLLIMLHNKKNEAYIDNIFKPAYNGSMVKRIFTIGIPNGIENGLFQLGGLILQGLVVSLGTVATTANALTYNLVFLMASLHNAFVLGIMPFVSQCIGAGKQDEAIFYTKHILKLNYLCVAINYILILPIIKPLANAFGVSPEATEIAVHLMHVYSFFSVLLYPVSFTLTNALRGTGDTKFTMVVSVVSMFIFRIGCAYLLAYKFGFGAESMWYAMIGDWVIRAIFFIARFKGGKWKKLKLYKLKEDKK